MLVAMNTINRVAFRKAVMINAIACELQWQKDLSEVEAVAVAKKEVAKEEKVGWSLNAQRWIGKRAYEIAKEENVAVAVGYARARKEYNGQKVVVKVLTEKDRLQSLIGKRAYAIAKEKVITLKEAYAQAKLEITK